MKKLLILSALALSTTLTSYAQDAKKPAASAGEEYGHTLNIGLGLGYYSYADHSTPVLHANYEFDVAKNFTLAPFITYFSYRNGPYTGGYYYHETVVPIGVKGSYYFDQLLDLNPNWDIYGAASLGFDIHTVRWDNGYTGDRSVERDVSPLYLDIHIGAEYHVSRKVGIFLDLSTGVSTIGAGFHL